MVQDLTTGRVEMSNMFGHTLVPLGAVTQIGRFTLQASLTNNKLFTKELSNHVRLVCLIAVRVNFSKFYNYPVELAVDVLFFR